MKSALNKAVTDTANHFKALVGVAFTGAVALAALFYWKGREMAFEEVPLYIVGLVGAFVGLSIAFLWNLACAPYRLEKEKSEKLEQRLFSITGFGNKQTVSNFVENRRRFTLNEAACLLANEDIKVANITGLSAGYLNTLKMKVLYGELRVQGIGRMMEHTIAFRAGRNNLGEPGIRLDEISGDFEISKSQLTKIAGELNCTIEGLPSNQSISS